MQQVYENQPDANVRQLRTEKHLNSAPMTHHFIQTLVEYSCPCLLQLQVPRSKKISPDCVMHFDLKELTHEQLCERWRQPCLHLRQILDRGLHGCRNPFMESCTHRCCIKTWMASESRRAGAKEMHTTATWTYARD